MTAQRTTSGAALARRYAAHLVAPLVEAHLPDVAFATARLGSGSDVLELDDEVSRDHDWGLRLTVLVDDPSAVQPLDRLLEEHLPATFDGHPVRFPTTWDPRSRHRVEVAAVDAFLESRLGFDPRTLDALTWLCVPGQAVLEAAGGPVFSDTTTTLRSRRAALAWYPEDVWRYVLASGWVLLGEELPFVWRTADRGDDLGSRTTTARLAALLAHLTFLLERRWAPYPKWSGSRLVLTSLGREVAGHLGAALGATTGSARTAGLAAAADALHRRQRALGLSSAPAATTPFHDRPTATVDERLVADLMRPVTDEALLALPPGLGCIEQWSTNLKLLTSPGARRAALGALRTRAP